MQFMYIYFVFIELNFLYILAGRFAEVNWDLK